jgi:23S rRNA pseudouridine1911/1915/1917 synthase
MGATVYPTGQPKGEAPQAEVDGWIPIGLTVEAGCDGYRLDRFLKARIGRLSRTRIQTIIGLGQVRRAASEEPLLRSSARVRAGDELVLLRPVPVEPPAVLDFTVLHRDEALLVIDKPAGLPVHPSARYHRHTLTALMRERLGIGHGWAMAHRIDRETSGVLVFGRSAPRRGRREPPSPAGVLKRSFQNREVEKEYLAIVKGTLQSASTIDIPIALDPSSRLRIKMSAMPLRDGGLPAQTYVDPIAHGVLHGDPITLLRCRPYTGRQHQIRIHLALVGHCVLGDKLYGLSEELFLEAIDGHMPTHELEARIGLSRQALHAHSIALPHPLTGERVSFTASWPRELAAVLPVPTARSFPTAL